MVVDAFKLIRIILISSFYLIPCIFGDIYLHNPRGSNNRLDEANRDRNNANRMFDSQNNNRGGYNVGNLYYYTKSKLQIEWTNQHSCQSPNANCEIILQYMCDSLLRDGSDTKTIPAQNNQCANNDCNTDFRYGMNENYTYYQNCQQRSRNKGLFIADQNVGANAKNTRQNPNGQRYGYECAEERDYYPYWQPTKWIDIAILTNNPQKCNYYRNESENVKSRWFCSVPNGYTGIIPINQNECEKIVYPIKNGTQAVWIESPSFNVDPPVCQETQFTRDNHLGNTIGGNPPTFDWTVPNIPNERCVLRIRYNISTNDYDRWQTFQNNSNGNNIAILMGLNQTNAQSRGYVLKNNPTIQLFPDLNLKLNLAINTAQYGRVFQDRSFVFAIRNRTANLQNASITNLNVRGKRGNIVQVYPAVEYDFVPNSLKVSKNDYIHIQWTGSNTNNANNAGQGLAGTDRSNIVVLGPATYQKGNQNFYAPFEVYGQYGTNYPSNINKTSFLGFSNEDKTKLALLQLNQFGGSMDELNDAGTYFDLGPRTITSSGVFHYMSTRNNNFSNRDQKGEIIVYENPFSDAMIGSNGGVVENQNAFVVIPPGAFDNLVNVRLDTITKDQILSDLNKLGKTDAIQKMNQFDPSSLASDFIVLAYSAPKTNQPLELNIEITRSAQIFESLNVYRISSDYSLFTKMGIKSSRGQLVAIDTTDTGIYVAKYEKNYSVLIGTLVAAGVIIVLITIGAIFLCRNPKYMDRMRYTACNAKRSMSDKL